MNEIITLANGLRLSYCYIPHVRSVCWGVFVAAGSVGETEKISGISHAIEHMCFKGTARRTALQLATEIDDLGANVNAFTSKEMTCYYFQCLDENVEACCDLLSDLVLHRSFDEGEWAKEKMVICEEIDMNEDQPDDVCSELASRAYWGNDPLARPILGTKESVTALTPKDMQEYVARYYTAENSVLSVVGHISREEAVRLAEEYFDFPSGKVEHAREAHRHCPVQLVREKEVEQANVIITYPGFAYDDPRCGALSVFDAVFGGGMSSILFQRVREQLGLAYSVYSFPSLYRDRGSYSIYIGTNPAKLDEAVRTVSAIIRELLAEGIPEEAFLRGKQQTKSAYVLGTESNMVLMRAMARRLLFSGRTFDMAEEVARLSSVQPEDVAEVIHSIFGATPSIGLVVRSSTRDYIQELNHGIE
ncbi:MAG: insulinase family protein [Clostridia bacterium]|nr:insulinase family protein [Clostridia bacterium]